MLKKDKKDIYGIDISLEMLNHLLLSLLLTGLFYFYNQRAGTILDNTQYILAFIGIAIGLAVVYRYFMPSGTAMPDITGFLGIEEPTNGPNGQEEVPCYNVPYHVIKTQYGDSGILAGYNENLATYESGAAGKFETPTMVATEPQCTSVGYEETKVKSD